MIYTELVNKAMKIAYKAHEGQFDKGGIPYIFHPAHIAEQMDTENRVCIALLHDVVEDSGVTLGDLKKEFPRAITDAVEVLTREPGMDYLDYISGVCTNIDASLVKMADLIHNMTDERMPSDYHMDDTYIRYNKYIKALRLITYSVKEKTIEGSKERILLNKIYDSYCGRTHLASLELSRTNKGG